MIISSIYRRTGYFFNDDRASGGALEEFDILTCPHCQSVIKIHHSQTEGPACRRCNRPICEPCNIKMQTEGCVSFKKLIDEALDREARERAYKKALGL